LKSDPSDRYTGKDHPTFSRKTRHGALPPSLNYLLQRIRIGPTLVLG